MLKIELVNLGRLKMSVPTYEWAAEEQFLGRANILARLESWWSDTTLEPVNLFGRRRVGKSWLFRKFAHGKPAIVLVVENSSPAQQLSKLAEQLEPYLIAKPEIKDITTFFRILYELTKNEKALVIIDEFPNLLGGTDSERETSLSSIQAVMEQYRDKSKIKLILCGSAIAQMEALQGERSPLHGRLIPLELVPLTFKEARDFFEGDDILDQFTRYSITGGMPRYLALLGKGDFLTLIASKIVDPNAPLFDEVPSLLAAELKEVGTYYSILSELSGHPKARGQIADAVGKKTTSLGHYLERLEAMRLLKAKHPVGAAPDSRASQYECVDGFVRFWFRFVAPYIADLESGRDARAHVDHFIYPNLAEHASIEFEHIFRRWVRQEYPQARMVGSWWGNSANVHRAAGVRSSEEIDVVGLAAKKVVVLGEAKWTNGALPYDVLSDLNNFKIPALIDGGLAMEINHEIVLTSRSGFTQNLESTVGSMPHVHLIDAADMLRLVQ